ncbi:MAG: hypothetical protein WC822_05750 [Candidatus Paceibacterota bacterium]|jgi:hypothetical protein
MPDIKKPDTDKPKPDTAWKGGDPWFTRSEEFYSLVYKGGSCRYCGKVIHSHLDQCGCPRMIAARDRFKRLVRTGSIVAPPAPKPIDNPDKFHAPDIDEIPF